MALTVYPVIRFNSAGTTTDSGAGPDTAITGTGGVTDGTTTVDLSTDSPDLSALPTDGSAVLFIQTSSGRRYSRISTWDNTAKTVTCGDTFVAGSSLSWSIGGKRSSLTHADSVRLWEGSGDAKDGWIIELEEDFTVAGTATYNSIFYCDVGANQLIIRGKSGAVRTLSNSATGPCVTLKNTIVILRNLKFENSSGTPANGIYIISNKGYYAEDCIIGDATNQFTTGVNNNSSGNMRLTNCIITDCTAYGNYLGLNNAGIEMHGCHVRNCGNDGVYTNGNASVRIFDSIIENCNYGVFSKSTGQTLFIKDSVIDGNTNDGINANNSSGLSLYITGSQITNNGGYGINCANDTADYQSQTVRNNNFGTAGAGANSSGAYTNLTQNACIEGNIAVDPGYTGSGDFTGGTAVSDKGFPSTESGALGAGASGTTGHKDIGIQRAVSGSTTAFAGRRLIRVPRRGTNDKRGVIRRG